MGQKIREERLAINYSRAALARDVGISSKRLQAIEEGRVSPTPEVLASVERALAEAHLWSQIEPMSAEVALATMRRHWGSIFGVGDVSEQVANHIRILLKQVPDMAGVAAGLNQSGISPPAGGPWQLAPWVLDRGWEHEPFVRDDQATAY